MPRFMEMPMDPSQVTMFGRTVDESVPGDSDVRALSEVMDLLDWSEVALICMAHNLLKYARNAQAMAYLAASSLISAFSACIGRFSGHMRQSAYAWAVIFETA